MDEASRILAPLPSAVIVTLARQAAIKAVKRQLQAQGRNIAYMSNREIVALADEYLAQHRHALLAQTRELVCSAPELRELYEREQRQRQRLLERISANMNSARRPDSQAISPCRNPLKPLPLVIAQEPPHADTLTFKVAFGAKRKSTGKPDRLDRSKRPIAEERPGFAAMHNNSSSMCSVPPSRRAR